MSKPKKIRLGESLLEEKLLTEEQLTMALNIQQHTSRKLGKILVEQGFISEEKISQTISKQLNIPFISLRNIPIDPAISHKLSEIQSRKFRGVVIKETPKYFTVAMSEPTDLMAYDEIENLLSKAIDVVCVTETDLLTFIDKAYKNQQDLQNIALELAQETKFSTQTEDTLIVEDAPVIKLLQNLFDDALKVKSSDIHIEPQEKTTIVRFRVDGSLFIHTTLPSSICAPLISRLKIISGLDITEKRLPQDGRFQIIHKNQPIDMRLSLSPQYYGEMAVIRVLHKNATLFNINDLGMPTPIQEEFKKIIHSSEGMILVCGPTGSGKTTTLYAGLTAINNTNSKIITIEDPVEYQIPMLNQIPINDKIGLDFSRVLRSVLRQDPDTIMIGEIRDTETAQIAMRASITGHLIFSTLHTKDVLSVPTRLIDMGIPPYMVAASLNGILSQRLIRLNCPHCKKEYISTEKEHILGESIFGELFNPNLPLAHSSGCEICKNTGFLGRKAVYEMLTLNEELSHYIQESNWKTFNQKANLKMNNNTMVYGVWELVSSGHVSLSEAFKLLSN